MVSDEKARMSDEAVAKVQTEFDRRLEEDADRHPLESYDVIVFREAFIYWNLMRNWFASLIAAKRYTDTEVDKIKSDWLDYICLMERRATLQSLEPKYLDNALAHFDEEDAVTKKITMIEDGMAAAVGKEAITQLEDVRSRLRGAFDRSGKKPMAPIGYKYVPISFPPYEDELVPEDEGDERLREYLRRKKE